MSAAAVALRVVSQGHVVPVSVIVLTLMSLSGSFGQGGFPSTRGCEAVIEDTRRVLSEASRT